MLAAFSGGGLGCKGKATSAEIKAEKTKIFRARQKNLAIKCYQDLKTKYPESEFAAQAEQRLQELGPPVVLKK